MSRLTTDFYLALEDVRSDFIDHVHESRFTIYCYSALKEIATLSHMLKSETKISDSRLIKLVKSDNEINVQIC